MVQVIRRFHNVGHCYHKGNNMYLEKVIFAIDNDADLHTVARFARHLDTQRALGKLQGDVVACIGQWTDADGHPHLEPSYMVNRADYDSFVASSGYVDKQTCVLLVAGDTRQPCSLLFPNGYTEILNPMRLLPTPVGVKDWTYVISTGIYFTC